MVGLYIGIVKQITRHDEKHIALSDQVTAHRADHKSLDSRVQGISRRVERHDADIENLKAS